jgi:hypothetical protein
MIISNLDKSAGFYSQFFFTLNHYLYAKYNNIAFEINSKKWLFKYKNGWLDYFNKIKYNLNNEHMINDVIVQHSNILGNFKINEYIGAIKDIYHLNDFVIDTKNIILKKYNLLNCNYSGIFIRRGDKLISESEYIPSSKYLEYLLKKNKDCKNIFLQTDDYSSYLELKKYIIDNNLNINIYTICNELTYGMIIFNNYKNIITTNDNLKYNKYLKNDKIINSKSIEQYDNDEIFNHTLDMLTGIDILLHSDICVLDYQSNVSRFIKLAHDNINNVYDVNNTYVDLNKKICPAYGF